MRALHLDYQRKATTRVWIVRWAVLAAGVLATVVAVESSLTVNKDLADLESRLARAERKSVPVLRGNLSAQDSKRFADEIKSANAIAEQLTFPWQDLLQAIEAGGAKYVALLSLEPDVSRKLLRITAEARNKADMLAYVQRLNADKRLQHVYVIDHEIRVETPGNPVRFSMQASLAAKQSEKR